MKYILYDTALNGPYTLLLLQKKYPVMLSLFAGTKDESLSEVAPYLVTVDDMLSELETEPLVSLRAIVHIETAAGIQTLATHLQQFIYGQTNGRDYFFRFWDARVLQKYLPRLDAERVAVFFECIDSVTLTDETAGTLHRYSFRREKLHIEEVHSAGKAEKGLLQEDTGSTKDQPDAIVNEKPRRKFFYD